MRFVLARVTAALALFAALGTNPYDFYTLMRWFVCGVCAVGAYRESKDASRHGQMWFYIALAVLFNPIAPLRLQRETWGPIDLLAGVALLGSVLLDWRKRTR